MSSGRVSWGGLYAHHRIACGTSISDEVEIICAPSNNRHGLNFKTVGVKPTLRRYNARRDNLKGFWKGQFGHTHGVIVVDAFYENVSRHKAEGRDLAAGESEESIVLEFRPAPRHPMLVACLFSQWHGHGEPDLLSFAAITDEPPPEIAAAGHDRCIIPIKEENLDAWLQPDPKRLDALYRIFDDRERPFYEHRMAA